MEMQPFDIRATQRHASSVDDGGGWQRPDARSSAEGQRHGVLAALAEQSARRAVMGNLFRYPDVRDEREAESHEVRRFVRERAERLEPLTRCCHGDVRDKLPADSSSSKRFMDDE
jgi:hypothetical protein